MANLARMALVITGLLFWKQKLQDMPRKPDTLAGVMTYLCGSHSLVGFEGCDRLTGSELEKRIGWAGKRYGFVDSEGGWLTRMESSHDSFGYFVSLGTIALYLVCELRKMVQDLPL